MANDRYRFETSHELVEAKLNFPNAPYEYVARTENINKPILDDLKNILDLLNLTTSDAAKYVEGYVVAGSEKYFGMASHIKCQTEYETRGNLFHYFSIAEAEKLMQAWRGCIAWALLNPQAIPLAEEIYNNYQSLRPRSLEMIPRPDAKEILHIFQLASEALQGHFLSVAAHLLNHKRLMIIGCSPEAIPSVCVALSLLHPFERRYELSFATKYTEGDRSLVRVLFAPEDFEDKSLIHVLLNSSGEIPDASPYVEELSAKLSNLDQLAQTIASEYEADAPQVSLIATEFRDEICATAKQIPISITEPVNVAPAPIPDVKVADLPRDEVRWDTAKSSIGGAVSIPLENTISDKSEESKQSIEKDLVLEHLPLDSMETDGKPDELQTPDYFSDESTKYLTAEPDSALRLGQIYSPSLNQQASKQEDSTLVVARRNGPKRDIQLNKTEVTSTSLPELIVSNKISRAEKIKKLIDSIPQIKENNELKYQVLEKIFQLPLFSEDLGAFDLEFFDLIYFFEINIYDKEKNFHHEIAEYLGDVQSSRAKLKGYYYDVKIYKLLLIATLFSKEFGELINIWKNSELLEELKENPKYNYSYWTNPNHPQGMEKKFNDIRNSWENHPRLRAKFPSRLEYNAFIGEIWKP